MAGDGRVRRGVVGALLALRRRGCLLGLRHLCDLAAQLRTLIRNHFDVLLGPGSDFIPVMLYESRSITPKQRATLAGLQHEYEAPWTPVLDALHASGQLKADVKLARLLMFGALNWSVQWYDRAKGASLDELTEAALGLFIGETS